MYTGVFTYTWRYIRKKLLYIESITQCVHTYDFDNEVHLRKNISIYIIKKKNFLQLFI